MTVALVVLEPRDGEVEAKDVTAATVDRWAPDPEVAERLRAHLAQAGCDVGPLVGLSFSITAPDEVIERAVGAPQGDGWGTSELPPDLATAVQAVTTGPEIDFGPVEHPPSGPDGPMV